MILTVDTFNLITLLCIKPLCAIGLCVYLLRSNPVRSAAKNNWLVFLGVLSPMLVVVSYGLLPSVGVPLVPSEWMQQGTIDIASLFQQESIGFYLLVSAVAVFVLGIVWGISYLLNGIAEIHRLTRNASQCTNKKILCCLNQSKAALQITGRVELKLSEGINAPVMWGVVNPTILLPAKSEQWQVGVLQRVLAHELAHIKRADWPVKMSVHILCCLFWFIPPVWWLAKKHEWFAELACDDMVVNALHCRAEYANDLLNFATHENQASIATLGFMKKSELYLRINAVLDGAKQRSAINTKEKLWLLIVWVGLLLPMSVAQALPKASSQYVQPVEYFPVWLPTGSSEKSHKSKSAIFTAEQPKVLTLTDLQTHFSSVPTTYRTNETMLITASRADALTASNSGVDVPQNPAALEQALVHGLEQRPQVKLEGFLPVNLVSPSYPSRALERGVEGRVTVQFDIDTKGKAVNVKIVQSTARGIFDKAVLKALEQSQFQPIRVNGHPIITKNVNETFLFTLASNQ